LPGDTLFTRRARMGELIGIPRSQTIPSDIQTQMNGYVEDAIRKITRTHEFPFMRGYDRIELQAKVSAGTVAVTLGGTAVTGTGTAFPTVWDGESYAEIRINREVYRVASITDATNLVLTDAATATETAADFQLYKARYLLPALYAIETVISTVGAQDAVEAVSNEHLQAMKAQFLSFGRPRYWACVGYVGGLPEIELYPAPNYNETLHVRGLKLPTIPSSDSDTDDIPEQWSHVVDLFAQANLFYALEDKRYGTAIGRAENELQEMIQQTDPNRDGARWELDPRFYRNPRRHQGYGGVVN
jgi:hypothetical protein